jgi:hypothetical protein
MRLSDIAIGLQNGAVTNPPHSFSLDHPAFAELELSDAPQNGEVFLLTVRATASDCCVVSNGERDRWSGKLTLTAVSLSKE